MPKKRKSTKIRAPQKVRKTRKDKGVPRGPRKRISKGTTKGMERLQKNLLVFQEAQSSRPELELHETVSNEALMIARMFQALPESSKKHAANFIWREYQKRLLH